MNEQKGAMPQKRGEISVYSIHMEAVEEMHTDCSKHSVSPRGKTLHYCKIFIISGVITGATMAVPVLPCYNSYRRT